ncbi:MAG: hypothetical protein LBQ02_03110 [Candidatus Nomurabacteria bacterium]|jgi:hypothetical protein|nr:hypothetical protein [Candidatus Nomurabacteria bacterium]
MKKAKLTPTQKLYKMIFSEFPSHDIKEQNIPQLIKLVDELLNKREAELIKLVYGLEREVKLIRQIGGILGVSYDTVRETHYRGIRKLYQARQRIFWLFHHHHAEPLEYNPASKNQAVNQHL